MSSTCPVVFALCVNERTAFVYHYELVDEDGNPVALAALTSLTLKIYDKATGTVIRAEGSILNANGGTYAATSGVGEVRITAADNAIVTSTSMKERHVAELDAQWSSNRRKTWEVEIDVKNLRLITA